MKLLIPVPDRGTGEGTGTCARDRRALQQLALNVNFGDVYVGMNIFIF